MRTTRRRMSVPVAALLLLCQVMAGAAAPLADAQEPERAPAAYEAHHDASCLVLHDALRCALCQYAGSLAAPLHPSDAEALAPILVVPTTFDHRWQAPDRVAGGSLPRAPPTPLS